MTCRAGSRPAGDREGAHPTAQTASTSTTRLPPEGKVRARMVTEDGSTAGRWPAVDRVPRRRRGYAVSPATYVTPRKVPSDRPLYRLRARQQLYPHGEVRHGRAFTQDVWVRLRTPDACDGGRGRSTREHYGASDGSDERGARIRGESHGARKYRRRRRQRNDGRGGPVSHQRAFRHVLGPGTTRVVQSNDHPERRCHRRRSRRGERCPGPTATGTPPGRCRVRSNGQTSGRGARNRGKC